MKKIFIIHVILIFNLIYSHSSNFNYNIYELLDRQTLGDINEDGEINIQDVILLINLILNNAYDDLADLNSDSIANVLDVVQIVNIILEGRLTGDATSAKLQNENGQMTIDANGYIGGVQMTLSHGADFSIELTDDAMVADYRTNDNTTTLIVVVPGSDELFTATGNFKVEEVIAANENGYVPTSMPTSFSLSAAYPNPFNPSTSLNLTMPSEGFVSVKAYNLAGQVVGIIADANYTVGTHSLTWDASDLSSGVYLVKAEYAGSVATQKVMLAK